MFIVVNIVGCSRLCVKVLFLYTVWSLSICIFSLSLSAFYELNIVLDTHCTDGTRTDIILALLALMLPWEKKIEKNKQMCAML